MLGLILNAALSTVESRDGPPLLWAVALGAGQARDAFDFAFQRVNAEGAWFIIELVSHSPHEPRLTGGLYAGCTLLPRRSLVSRFSHLPRLNDPMTAAESDTLSDMTELSARLQEGALSARNTPIRPPAETRLVPLVPAARSTVQGGTVVGPDGSASPSQES